MKTAAATIYVITNLVNGKTYIGLTRFSVSKRWREHRYHAKAGLRTRLYSALRKYGPENFTISPLASCLSLQDASEVERMVISVNKPEYNQTNGGEFTAGKRVSREVVGTIVAKNTGLKRTPEHNQRMSEIKKQQYAERPDLRAAVIAQLNMARQAIDQNKRSAAAGKSARERIWTAASRAKLSASLKGHRLPQEVIDRMARKKDKPVECVTLGVTFDSVSEAAHHLRIGLSSISKACIGKTQKTAGGMKFEFV